MKQPELKTWQSLALGILIGGAIMAAAFLISMPDRTIPLSLLPTRTLSPLLVYVTGEVKTPGVVSMAPGDRVQDALAAAGGTTDDSNVVQINLAALVTDGQKIIIPRKGETISTASSTVSSSSNEIGLLIHLNTASQKELEKLPGIGEEKAKAIIAKRDIRGKYLSIDELSDVPGISDTIINQIRPFLVVE